MKRSLIIKETGGGQSQFIPVPAGTHVAVCTIVADIGYHPGFENGPPKRNLYIAWEIPSERVTWTDKEKVEREGPSRIGAIYTYSLNEKANLRKMLSSWRGRDFNEKELAGFDLFTIMGKGCLLSVVHRESNGNTFANVKGVMGLPKGTAVPKAEGKVIAYGNSSEYNDVFEDLPKWIQRKVLEQIDMTAQVEQAGKQKSDEKVEEPEFDDDIPF